MKFGIVIFPGSNCDTDCHYVVREVLKQEACYLWHADSSPIDCDCVVLPGGFSYGDYLRPGAMARFSPIMERVVEFAQAGGLVLGICNGFQILLEAGLLPGAMMINKGLKFICHDTLIRAEGVKTPFTNLFNPGQVLSIPVNHYEGNYFADGKTLKALEERGQVLFRYCDAGGNITEAANPNGSLHNIAGLINEGGNVLGMMPHPERKSERELGGEDGASLFGSMVRFHSERG